MTNVMKRILNPDLSMRSTILRWFVKMISRQPRVLDMARALRFRVWILLTRLRSDASLDVNKIIWVNPKEIRYCALELEPKFNMGRVISGDWDKSTDKFEDSEVFQSFKKRFIEGAAWETTGFYKEILKGIERDRAIGDFDPRFHWGCRSKRELNARMKKVDDLYHDIKANGYKLTKNIAKGRDRLSKASLRYEEEVTVNIGREGEVFFNDGRHRLAIAKILGIERIPAKVVARHPEWLRFRKELLTATTNGKIYHRVTHPDLNDIPSHFGSFRFELIKSNMSVRNGTLLDIGAHLGYFCHCFEEMGFDCYAVEIDPATVYLLTKLARVQKRVFKIVPQSIFDYKRGEDLSFDVVLALNVFHHFLKTQESYEELIVLLRRIKTSELFFQAHDYDEPQMKGAYRNFYPDEFVGFVAEYTGLTNCKLIGKTEDNRGIYRLSHAQEGSGV